MNEHDELIARVAETLKEPVRIDPRLDARVMAEIEAGRAAVPPTRRVLDWLTQARTIRLSPLGGLAIAAGVIVLWWTGTQLRAPSPAAEPSLAAAATLTTTVQFVLIAPDAQSVSVVGDFNDWDVSATMLREDQAPGVWAVTVPLSPGRYRYSFLVDGTTWLTDPLAAQAVADEFGRPNSVVTIGES